MSIYDTFLFATYNFFSINKVYKFGAIKRFLLPLNTVSTYVVFYFVIFISFVISAVSLHYTLVNCLGFYIYGFRHRLQYRWSAPWSWSIDWICDLFCIVFSFIAIDIRDAWRYLIRFFEKWTISFVLDDLDCFFFILVCLCDYFVRRKFIWTKARVDENFFSRP